MAAPYLSYYYKVNDINNNPHTDCFPISAASLNTDTRFRIYTNSSGLPIIEFTNSTAGYEKLVPLAGQFDPEYSQITYAETYFGTATGGLQWYWLDGAYPHDPNSEGGLLEECGYTLYGLYPECIIGG